MPMKKIAILFSLLALMCSCASKSSEPKISIFVQHIETIAEQENIPIAQIVDDLVRSGYDGWFTVEQFGSKNMLKDSETSYANVKAMIESASKK